jgi:predicted MPP superfamily phosphohydrolase
MSTIDRAITLGLSVKPDLVCVTGDFVTRAYGYDADYYVSILKRLPRAAPTFAVLGNHDGGKWAGTRFGDLDTRKVRSLLDRAGIQLLYNRAVAFQSLTLIGVGDMWANEIDADAAFALAPSRGPRILLSHNPDSKEVLGAYDWDLMLSGHTHGGQVIIPFEGPRYAPVMDKRYVAGLKPWRDRQIHVTRGVGNVGGVRFRCRPEVSLLIVNPVE